MNMDYRLLFVSIFFSSFKCRYFPCELSPPKEEPVQNGAFQFRNFTAESCGSDECDFYYSKQRQFWQWANICQARQTKRNRRRIRIPDPQVCRQTHTFAFSPAFGRQLNTVWQCLWHLSVCLAKYLIKKQVGYVSSSLLDICNCRARESSTWVRVCLSPLALSVWPLLSVCLLMSFRSISTLIIMILLKIFDTCSPTRTPHCCWCFCSCFDVGCHFSGFPSFFWR